MKVRINSRVHVSDPTPEMRQFCEDNLIIDNPEYAKKLRMGRWLGNTPKKLYLYEEDGDNLILPYGCLKDVLIICKDAEIVNEIVEHETIRSVRWAMKIPLYDYQQKAVDKMLSAYYGILKAPAGSGKTQMGLALAATINKKTLWLTHTKDLINQSKDRCEKYISYQDTGTIVEGHVKVGRYFTFATVQTMARLDLSQFRDTWDVIIVDEVHRVAASPTSVTMFQKVLNSLSARHKYGLSATVHRADGMIKSTFALIGNIEYEVPESEVVGKIMQITVNPRPTNMPMTREFLDTDGTIMFTRLITLMTLEEERNQQIVNDLVANKKHYNLILSDRLAHLDNQQ